MNRENMTTLRDHLVNLRAQGKARKFNMGRWLAHPDHEGGEPLRVDDLIVPEGTVVSPYECQTVACLAGHAALIGGALPSVNVEHFARDWLDLTPDQALHLFYGFWAEAQLLKDITIDQAIDHLTNLIGE